MSRKSKVLSPVVTTTVYTMLSIMEGGPPPSEMTKASAISVHRMEFTQHNEARRFRSRRRLSTTHKVRVAKWTKNIIFISIPICPIPNTYNRVA